MTAEQKALHAWALAANITGFIRQFERLAGVRVEALTLPDAHTMRICTLAAKPQPYVQITYTDVKETA